MRTKILRLLTVAAAICVIFVPNVSYACIACHSNNQQYIDKNYLYKKSPYQLAWGPPEFLLISSQVGGVDGVRESIRDWLQAHPAGN